MSARPYLPSRQFTFIVGSILCAAGLVLAAQYTTRPKAVASLAIDQTATAQNADWQKSLADLQDEQGSSLPTPPDPDMVQALRQNAQTANLTDSVARSLLINVTDARAQGLGDDMPTQNQLLNAALAQVQQTSLPSKIYTDEDLVKVSDSNDMVRAYANALIVALKKHPSASVGDTMQILGDQINGRANHLSKLPVIGREYSALAKDLLKIAVPQSLAAFHLSIINDYLQMADTFPNMAMLATDPLRALSGLQSFTTSGTNVQNLFINIARVLDKDGILFNKDEPGATWATLVSGQ